MIEFEDFGKTPRLNRAGSMTISEKIDGSNAAVVIEPVEHPADTAESLGGFRLVAGPGYDYVVGAQSRNRLIFPGKSRDNAGFAGWVDFNAEALVDLLGPGRHFGEWWGQGVQRGYGLDHKVFSLFNTRRWLKLNDQREGWLSAALAIQMDVVPELYTGAFSDQAIRDSLDRLKIFGSKAAENWGVLGRKAEGVIIYHHELRGKMKAFIENDDVPKSLQQKEEEGS